MTVVNLEAFFFGWRRRISSCFLQTVLTLSNMLITLQVFFSIWIWFWNNGKTYWQPRWRHCDMTQVFRFPAWTWGFHCSKASVQKSSSLYQIPMTPSGAVSEALIATLWLSPEKQCEWFWLSAAELVATSSIYCCTQIVDWLGCYTKVKHWRAAYGAFATQKEPLGLLVERGVSV